METLDIPKIIFIVPYRNREVYLDVFLKQMTANMAEYRIVVVHQTDTRAFNRGAIKNIGFLYVKQMYPEHYGDITLVFNDVDTVPKKHLPYQTTHGTVKHFFGFTFTLGGIVSITGKDFERINGFPNYWGWGYEDNMLQLRVSKSGLRIDRSCFYDLNRPDHVMDDTAFICINSGVMRDIHKTDFLRYISNAPDGINSIRELEYTITYNTIPEPIPINNEPPHMLPTFIPKLENTIFMKSLESLETIQNTTPSAILPFEVVNVSRFFTETEYTPETTIHYDLTNGSVPFSNKSRRSRMQMTFDTL